MSARCSLKRAQDFAANSRFGTPRTAASRQVSERSYCEPGGTSKKLRTHTRRTHAASGFDRRGLLGFAGLAPHSGRSPAPFRLTVFRGRSPSNCRVKYPLTNRKYKESLPVCQTSFKTDRGKSCGNLFVRWARPQMQHPRVRGVGARCGEAFFCRLNSSKSCTLLNIQGLRHHFFCDPGRGSALCRGTTT